MKRVLPKHVPAVQFLVVLAVALCVSPHARAAGNITSSIAGSINGTIEPMGICNDCSSQEYRIMANPGYHLSWVKVDGEEVASYTIADNVMTYSHEFTDLDADHSIEAAFTQRIAVIENSPFGSIVPAPVAPYYTIEVEYGRRPTFELTASDPCENGHTHHVSDILVDGVATGIRGQGEKGPYSYTFPYPVTKDSSIEAQFTGHVDVTVTGPGSVELGEVVVVSSGSIEFESAIEQTFSILSGTGYHAESVLFDGVEQGRLSELKINEMVARDHTLQVKFAIDSYSIEPVSAYGLIFDDPLENTLATTQYPLFGQNLSYFIDINNATHAVEAVLIDNVRVPIPAKGGIYVDPGGVFKLINTGGATLEVLFTGVQASHRLVVIDYDRTPIIDIPLVATSEAAPANIMYIIDDSGSMISDMLVPGGEAGLFCEEYYEEQCIRSIYGLYDMEEIYRLLWKSQWFGFNRLYYNPAVEYVPWPRIKQVSEKLHDGKNFVKLDTADADPLHARYFPLRAHHLKDLTAEFVPIPLGPSVVIDDGDGDDNPDTSFSMSSPSDWKEENPYDAHTCHNMDRRVSTGVNESAWARWSWTPDASGHFTIALSFVVVKGNSENVNFEVACPTCTAPIVGDSYVFKKSVSQSADHYVTGNMYAGLPSYTLGNFMLQKGKTVTVTLKDTHTQPWKVNIDAVRFYPSYSVPIAHYYTWSEIDASPYLVALDNQVGKIRYFRVSGTSVDKLLDRSDDHLTLSVEVTGDAIPADVRSVDDYSTALQNFANWYTYYRMRTLSAIAAASRSLVQLQGVQVGLTPLTDTFVMHPVPVEKVKVEGIDRTDYLLEKLYLWRADQGTPLRDALEEVGEYFADTDTDAWSKNLPSPYWTSEKGGSCQQSFAILVTDGYDNTEEKKLASYHKGADDDNTELVDRDGHYLYSDAYPPDPDDESPSPPEDEEDTADDHLYTGSTLADIAMYFYENDLSPLPNDVNGKGKKLCTGEDPVKWQHMRTFTVSFGLQGTVGDPADYTLCGGKEDIDYPKWPPIKPNNAEAIDDLWHAAVNGRGNFMYAADSNELVKSLDEIVKMITESDGSSASVAINGDDQFEAINGDIRMYQTSYNTAGWSGDVQAYRLMDKTDPPALDAEDSNGIVDASIWSASSQLASFLGADGANAVHRKVFTYNTETSQGVVFNESHLSGSQLLALFPYFQDTGATASDVIQYLRGDDAKVLGKTGGVFRRRNGPLGDFVNSKARYQDGVLYVGGNDGMLHAFDATDTHGGKELFAYVPSFVYPQLRKLADPAYEHNFFVDSTPYTKRIDTSSTLLVGGLGKGGKGYFGLDVSHPGSFSHNNVLWEYPAPPAGLISDDLSITFSNNIGNDTIASSVKNTFAGDAFAPGKSITVIGADCSGHSNNGTYEILGRNADGNALAIVDGSLNDGCGDGKPITVTESTTDPGIGYSFSTAVIVKSNDSTINAGTSLEGYVVIFGNGYTSEDGTAQLYVLDPLNGNVITKIDTGFGPANGLSSPKAIDVDYDLAVDYVYAGDLLGNMWKFDLQSINSSHWQVAFCENGDATSHCNADGADLKPLFTTAKRQPITAAPDVMIHPTYKGYMVVFGTGQFLGMPDLITRHTQSLYGIWDWAPDEYDEGYLGLRMDTLEDIDLDGRLDTDEDLNNNGDLDPGEDVDGDGNLDVDEDVNLNGRIDALSPTLLSNGPVVDGLGNSTNTLVRQEVLVEGTLTEDSNRDDILSMEEDVNENGKIDTYSYFRIPSNSKVDWTLKATDDLNNDGKIDARDRVPQVHLGWCFDLPGKIMDADAVDNDGDGNIDEPGERSLGERVTNDAIIRDGRVILVSFGVTGTPCDIGLFSFVNERNAETGGGLTFPILDINGDGQVNTHDLVRIVDENGKVIDGIATDKSYGGRLFNPAILAREDDGEGDLEETKFMSSSSGAIEVLVEKAERRGIYYWQQIE